MSTIKKNEILALGTEERVEKLAVAISENNGAIPEGNGSVIEKRENKDTFKQAILVDLKSELAKLDSLRKGDKDNSGIDLSLGEYMQERYCIAPDQDGGSNNFLQTLGIDPSHHSIASLTTMGEISEGYHAIIPEVLREAIRLGLRTAPIYPDLIRTEESVSAPQITMPDIKMSDAMPKQFGELETIDAGAMSFGSKTVKIKKMGIGVRLSDEAQQYSAINLLSIYTEDVGIKLGLALDQICFDTIFNGDQADGSDSIAVIGSENGTSLAYYDLLRAWVRMQILGNSPTAMLMNEKPALDILQMSEFKNPSVQYAIGSNPSGIGAPALNFKTGLPQNQDVFAHGAMPNENYVVLVNKMNALIKLNAQPLRVEAQRDASKQFTAFYVSLTTGFATLKRDARLCINKATLFSGAGFPTWMDVQTYQATRS